MVYTLIIKGRLAGLNALIGANRQNKYAGAKLKKDEDYHVSLFIRQQLKDMPELDKFKMDITWYEKDRRRDPDNIISAKKNILDALVQEGKLKNDGFNNFIGLSECWKVDKDNPRIEVRIKGV